MKMKLLTLTALCGAAFAATPAWAQYNLHAGQFYVHADAGVAKPQDLLLRNTGETVSIDAGSQVDVSAGFNALDFMAVELQTGATWNRLHTDGVTLGSISGNRTEMTQVPMMANVIFKVPLADRVTPYIGGGAGGVATSIDIRRNHHWTGDSDVTFAYQGMAGVEVAITEHISVGVGYRLLGTTDHTWFADDPAMYMPTGKTITHAGVANFTWTF